MIICYTVPEIWHVTDIIDIFYFGLFLPFHPPLPPLSPNSQKNFTKMKQMPGDIIITHMYQTL